MFAVGSLATTQKLLAKLEISPQKVLAAGSDSQSHIAVHL
jgi:hypothetical protein